MATPKRGARGAAPKKKPAARAAKTTTLTIASIRASIVALSRSDLPEKLRCSVSDLLFHAGRLRRSAKKLREELLANSRLKPAVIDSLPFCIEVLEEAEDEWQTLRSKGAPKALKDARIAAAKLRGVAVKALRHFCEEDNELQVRLNEIMEGDGDADLVDDLKKLAPLVDANWDAISAEKKLPRDKSDAYRKRAAQLEELRLANEPTPEAKRALEFRDKAFFYLLDAEREIRKCGRYAFSEEPKLAELFADPFGSSGGSSNNGSAPPAT
ncbi:MAG: hypothetical protein JNK05_00330 [Myxococcales bacterium]|nr:hypothetical protein [Myxococcales bacterium]